MYTRNCIQSFASSSTANLKTSAATALSSGFGEGNIFVGGTGKIAVANQTDDFICAGGQSQLRVANRGNNAYIQGGSQSNEIFSVGHNCTIYGGNSDDQIFSIGTNCNISLMGGDDTILVNGAGTIVDGGDGSDLGSGALAGLTFNSLFRLDVVSMLNKILKASEEELITWYRA